MPKGLKRFYGRGELHFLTLSCYRRWLIRSNDDNERQAPRPEKASEMKKPHAQNRRMGHPDPYSRHKSGPPATVLNGAAAAERVANQEKQRIERQKSSSREKCQRRGRFEARNRSSQSAERLTEPCLPPNCGHGAPRLTRQGRLAYGSVRRWS